MKSIVIAFLFSAVWAFAQTEPSEMRARMNQTRGALDRPTGLNTPGMANVRSAPTATPRSSAQGLPWPIEGHAFTLTELNVYRNALAGQVVWVKLTTVDVPPEPTASGYRVFVTDGKSDGEKQANYAFVHFPEEGVTKMNLLGKTTRRALSFYVKVDPSQLTAVARSKKIDSFTNTFAYTW